MNSIRTDFKECIKNNDVKELNSFLIEKGVTKEEFNYLLDNLTWQKFNFIISLLAHENLLDKYFEKEQLCHLLNTYQDYLIYNNERTKYKLVEFYPKIILFLVKFWNEKKIIKTFQYSEFFEEIIYVLIENTNYLKILKDSCIGYKYNDINSSKVLLIICKYIAYHLDIFSDQIANDLNEYTWDEAKIKFNFSEWFEFFRFYKNFELKFYDFKNIITFYKNNKDIAMFISDSNNREYSKNIEEKILNYIKAEGFGLMLEILPENFFCGELKRILDSAKTIVKASGKVNIAESNDNFKYTMISQIYPILGMEETLNLLKYKTNGSKKVINLFETGKEDVVLETLALEKKFNIFGGIPETIHLLFENIDSWELLRKSLLKTNATLSKENISCLKSIILSSNFLGIENITQLIDEKEGYNNILYQRYESLYHQDKDSQLFGIDSNQKLFQIYTGYNLNDINKLKKIYQLANFPKELLLTKEDYEVIKILRSKYKCTKETYLDNVKKRYHQGKSLDMSEDLQTILLKIRKTYEYVFNNSFSQISDFNSLSEVIDGVRVINLTSEPFNFLIHTIKGYSRVCESYVGILKENPSLWDKLDGSSTISMCYIQDNILKFVGRYEAMETSEPVLCYLFNHIPTNQLMFMDTTDAFVKEEKNLLNPTVSSFSFSDLDELSYYTRIDEKFSYNEVVMRRNMMNPCAIAIFKRYPNAEEIRAAQYFGIPIINFYQFNKPRNTQKNKDIFKQNPSKELARNIIYKSDNFTGNMKWIIAKTQNLRNNNKITHEDYLKIIYYVYQESKIINQRYLEEFIKKLILSYTILKEGFGDFKIKLNFDKDEIIIIINKKKYIFLFDAENIEKKIAINKFKSRLGIKCLDNYLSFKIKSKNYYLTDYVDYTSYANLTWNSYSQSRYSEELMKEYVLHLLFGQISYYTLGKDFKINVENNMVFSMFDLDPSSIINITKEDYPKNLNDVFYYYDDILGQLMIRIKEGRLNDKLDIMIAFAEQIESIPEEEFKEMFNEYFASVEKNEGTSSEYLMDLLLKQKRNLKSYILDMLKMVPGIDDIINKRTRKI